MIEIRIPALDIEGGIGFNVRCSRVGKDQVISQGHVAGSLEGNRIIEGRLNTVHSQHVRAIVV